MDLLMKISLRKREEILSVVGCCRCFRNHHRCCCCCCCFYRNRLEMETSAKTIDPVGNCKK